MRCPSSIMKGLFSHLFCSSGVAAALACRRRTKFFRALGSSLRKVEPTVRKIRRSRSTRFSFKVSAALSKRLKISGALKI